MISLLRRWHVSLWLLALVLLLDTSTQAAPSTSLEATLDLGEPFRSGVSLLWSPTGQASWDILRDYHGVDKIETDPRSPTAEALNKTRMDRASVLPNGTVIFAGDDSPAFRQQVKDELRKRIGESAAAMIGPYRPPGMVSVEPPIVRIKSALMVSAISCKPRFPSDFVPEADPRLFVNSRGQNYPVLGFGTSGKMSAEYGDAVRVLEDDLAGSHSLRLGFFTKSEKDRECLVLTSGISEKNMDAALTHVRDLLRKERTPEKIIEAKGQRWRYMDTLSAGDALWVPHLNATMCCDYPDLINKQYLRVGNDYWQIIEATQLLNVRLDHKGALVQAVFKVSPDFLTAAGGPSPGDPPPKPLPVYPKSFVFDKPFLATLWREGADWPYMAFWVDGPEMLTLARSAPATGK